MKVKLLETCGAGPAGAVVEVEDAGWFLRRGWAEPVAAEPAVKKRKKATSKKAETRDLR